MRALGFLVLAFVFVVMPVAPLVCMSAHGDKIDLSTYGDIR